MRSFRPASVLASLVVLLFAGSEGNSVWAAPAPTPCPAPPFTFSRTELSVDAAIDGPKVLALGDLNNDGKADIVVCDGEDDLVDIYMNDGTGAFPADAQSFATDATPIAVVIADFNHDGNPDLAVVATDDDAVSILFGDGQGNFNNRQDFSVSLSGPIALVAADFDQDGSIDLAVMDDSDIDILKNDGNGNFFSFPGSPISTRGADSVDITAGLLNQDAFPDLAVANSSDGNVTVFLGNGDGTFQAPKFEPVDPNPVALVQGNINSDANADLAVVDDGPDIAGDMNVSVLYGNGNGTFGANMRTTAGETATAIALADFDGDGKIDMAVTSDSGGLDLTIEHNDPNGLGDPGPPCANPNENGFTAYELEAGNLLAVQQGQINADGRPDLAVLTDDGLTIYVFTNTTGSVVLPTNTPTPPQTGGTLTPVPSAATGTPEATFTITPTATPTLIPVPYGACNTNEMDPPIKMVMPVAVAVGDFNHDGNKDIAVADRDGNQVLFLMSHIMPTPAPATPSPAGSKACSILDLTSGTPVSVAQPVALTVGTFHQQSSNLDVAVVGAAGLSVFWGDGSGGFAPGPTYALPTPTGTPVPALPMSLAMADFNLDGKPDILVANGSSSVFLFLGNGDGSFEACAPIDVTRNVTLVVAKDFDGDRRPDFAVASDEINTLSIWLRIGNSTPAISTPPACLTAVDFSLVEQPDPRGLPRALTAVTDISPELAVALSWFPPLGTPTPNGTPTPGRVALFPNNGTMSGSIYGLPSTLVVPTPDGGQREADPSALAAGDASVPPDQRTDLVVADRNNDEVVVFFASAQGGFATAARPVALRQGTPGPVKQPVAVTMSDIDRDGTDDVITANAGDGSVSILLSAAQPPTPTPPPTATSTATPSATATNSPLPPGTPTVTPTITPTAIPPSTTTPAPTGTVHGVVSLNGACAVDPAGSHSNTGASAVWITMGIAVALRRWGSRSRPTVRQSPEER